MRCVPAHHFTVAKARTWRSAIDQDPPYQRESSVWSLDKQQLFIDSLLNGYDVPKIYLHDLRGEQPTPVYAIVDGKQRLTTIWGYLDDAFPLAADFRIEPGHLPDLPAEAVTPVGALRFSQLDPHWQRVLTGTFLSVVLIRDAREADIEDLFSRLNNGEALNAAERRNALGGDMVRLIREVARRPFFTDRLAFSNARHQHFDLVVRLLAVEVAHRRGASGIPDLGARALDALVRDHRQLSDADRAMILERIDAQLAVASQVFSHADPLLGSPAQALLHYLYAGAILGSVPSERESSELRAFLGAFHRARSADLERPEDARDAALAAFSKLMRHGVNEPRNLEQRLAILRAAHVAAAGPNSGA